MLTSEGVRGGVYIMVRFLANSVISNNAMVIKSKFPLQSESLGHYVYM
jgi:hypothetical protein